MGGDAQGEQPEEHAQPEARFLVSKEHQQIYQRGLDHLEALVRAHQGEPDALRSLLSSLIDTFRSDPNSMLRLAFLASDKGFLMPHSLNVCLLALNLSIGLGYSESEMEELGLASLLHDMGMFTLPPGLIYSPDHISNEGRELLRQHPDEGWRRAQDLLDLNRDIAQAIYQEHEREDGSGYPEGVTSRAIHEFAKILGTVDVFEALTHTRPYRGRLSPYVAMREVISQGSQGVLDRGAVKAFVSRTSVFPIGSFVQLNTGEIAQVVGTQPGHPLSPIVEIVVSREGKKLRFRRSIDLSQEPIMAITKVLNPLNIEPLRDMEGVLVPDYPVVAGE